MSHFPPITVFPLAIDSNETLLLVYNTSESAITADNEPWAEEIPITPVAANKPEIWADNGFATIEEELFYYDAVEKDANNKVNKLIRCARALGGAGTKFNISGTMVRGFVVAEHHNMLVDATVAVEKFVGYNFTTDTSTLDWRIRNLAKVPIIFDDFGCPDISFTFNIISTDPSEGTLTSYAIDVNGSFTSFTLTFGDGTSTNSVASGEHRYSPNAIIDPVLTIVNNKCTVVQTQLEREQSDQPVPAVLEIPFLIPILPEIIIPNIVIPSITPIPTDVNLPPFMFPCNDFGLNISPINIPSVIVLAPFPSIINISPTTITISDDIPTEISITATIPSTIIVLDDIETTITVTDDIPTTIVVTDTIPESISVSDDIPTSISVSDDVPTSIDVTDDVPTSITVLDDVPTSITVFDDIPSSISVVFPAPPSIPVNWGTPPSITVTVTCPSSPSMTVGMGAAMAANESMLMSPEDIEVSYDVSGFPSEVRLTHELPSEIILVAPRIEPIELVLPEFPEIKIALPDTPLMVDGIPDVLKLDFTDFPRYIELAMPVSMPIIQIDANNIPTTIAVTGFPQSISIDPIVIDLKTPDFIPTKYVGDAIPVSVTVQLELNMNKLLLENSENVQCVAIVPCPKN